MLATKSLEELTRKNLIRTRYHTEPDRGNIAQIDGYSCINFSNNDYLGLSKHPKVIQACKIGLDHYGFGSGASPIVSGYTHAQSEFETMFAQLVKRPAALFFNSGYHANLAVMQCIADRQSHVIADKLIHASILDGIALSKAKLQRYQHANIEQAETLLASGNKNKILVSESIFSMEGDVVNLEKLANSAQKYNADFIVDDAHGFGILGHSGAGACQHYNLSLSDVKLLVTPLGKALGGMGAMVTGSEEDIEILLQFSRSYRYSTALPPAIAIGMQTGLNLLSTEHWRRKKLQENIQHFITQINQTELSLISHDPTPIMSILIGDNQQTVKLQKELMQSGFFVSCIRPPTVPEHTARLRITLTCDHQLNDIKNLIQLIQSKK